MRKEKYVTPEADVVAISKSDVITTSPVLSDDELKGIDQSFFEENTGLWELF